MTLIEAVKEVLWLRVLVNDFRLIHNKLIVFCDIKVWLSYKELYVT